MRSKQTYLLIERLDIVRSCIESGMYPSSSDLRQTIFEKLGTAVSMSTIYRDIEFLRNRDGMNVNFDASKKGYFVTKKSL